MRARILLMVVATCSAFAGTTGGGDLRPCRGKTIFVTPMPENFEQYLMSEIVAQKVDLNVTVDEKRGECTMRGTVRLDFWRGHSGSASVQVIGPNSNVVWSATSGDKDSIKDLSHNLVKQLKQDLQSSK